MLAKDKSNISFESETLFRTSSEIKTLHIYIRYAPLHVFSLSPRPP